MDYKKWKSGRHEKLGRWPEVQMHPEDVELYHSMKKAKRFRQVCPYCMEHKRTCTMCAGVY